MGVETREVDGVTELIGVIHCKRSEIVPHWLHQATMTTLRNPCPTIHAWEGHIFDIGRSRQKATEAVLSIPEVTHVLYVDDDLATDNRDALVGMYRFLKDRNEHIVSGLYYNKSSSNVACSVCGSRKHDPIIFNVVETNGHLVFSNPFRGRTPDLNTMYQVGVVPAGFLLVTREVFEKIPKPWFVYGDPELRKRFDANENGPGEDVYFSIKARAAGFKLWIDSRAEFAHYAPEWVGRQELIDKLIRKPGDFEKQAPEVREEYLRAKTVADRERSNVR